MKRTELRHDHPQLTTHSCVSPAIRSRRDARSRSESLGLRGLGVGALSASLLVLAACGDSASNDDAEGGASSGTASGAASVGGGSSAPFAACGGLIVKSDGTIDEDEYRKQARLWDRETIDCRLGPSFTDLNGDAMPTRPTAWEPPHVDNPSGYLCKKYELSGECAGGCDYGSTSGQVLFAPSDATQTGVDRAQTYAYENGTICESPQAGGWLGGPHPDPAIVQWAEELGMPVLLPNAFHQTELYQTNGGILTFPSGLVGATGNQTSGGSNPKFMLPPNKVPTSVAVTGYNEFAFVTIWDTDTLEGQIAVFALRADSPGAFSVPYFALPNEAGFKNIHLMGYVDLPDMKTPTAISALGNNGSTPGGHAIGNEFANKNDPNQNIATNEERRMAFARDDYERWVPTAGHAVVVSRWENKATFVDLRPLFQFVRDSYFTTKQRFDESATQDTWATFASAPESMPTVVTTLPIEAPTVLRVGNMQSGFAAGLELGLHAFVANLAGEVHVFDISGFMEDGPRPVPAAGIREITSIDAGRNITSMRKAGHANTTVVVASRGDAKIQVIELQEEALVVTREITDTRIVDPVVVDLSDRGPIVTVGDFTGQKIMNFRVGRTENNGGKPPANYGCGMDGADMECEDLEFGGELTFPGAVFYIGTTNVN